MTLKYLVRSEAHSPLFQRVQMKQSIAEEVGAGETRMSRQKSGLLCARRSNKRKKKEVPYSAQYHDDYEGSFLTVYSTTMIMKVIGWKKLEKCKK